MKVESLKDYINSRKENGEELSIEEINELIEAYELNNEEKEEILKWLGEDKSDELFLDEDDDGFEEEEEVTEETLDEDDDSEDSETIDSDSSDFTPVNTVAFYLKQIGQYDLLTFEEEKELFGIISEKNKIFKKAEKEFEKAKSAEAKLEKKADEADSQKLEEAKNKLKEKEVVYNEAKENLTVAKEPVINSNLRLVVSVAKKYTHQGIMFQDLIQEGNKGLMVAVEKFDVEKGYKFSTYATWWIRQSITRFIHENDRDVRLPTHIKESINKIKRTEKMLYQELNREPTVEEIALALPELSLEKIKEFSELAQSELSLQQQVKTDEADSTFGDFIEDSSFLTPEESMAAEDFRESIFKLMRDTLTEREMEIIICRTGLDGDKPRTLGVIGEQLGISRERVRQLERISLNKMRKAILLNNKHRHFLEDGTVEATQRREFLENLIYKKAD